MIATTTAFTLDGITAKPVNVEVDIQRGLPTFQIIGLADAAVRETRERVRASLLNSGYEFPLRRISVNLTPRDLRKVGPSLDLAIAAALLAAAGEIPTDTLHGWSACAELALDGSLRPVRGALAIAEAARDEGCQGIIVPPANGEEAALANGIDVRTITNVSDLRGLANGNYWARPNRPDLTTPADSLPDLADLRGQESLRDALEVAAAGGHGLLMVGPPGSGKSLAARRLPSILPPMEEDEALEVVRLGSCCGTLSRLSNTRPFRAPHHTVSAAGLVGGGNPMRPGEITLAHRGVLFLDELCEFRREALEGLREPLATGQVEITRGHDKYTMPADVQLITAANPCACGWGEHHLKCSCSASSVRRYRSALWGAFSDRVDMNIKVKPPTSSDITGEPGESSAAVRERVIAARERMTHRYGARQTNAKATPSDIAQFRLTDRAQTTLDDAWFFSEQDIDRVKKLARTIADVNDAHEIGEDHINEAIGYCAPHRPAVC